MIRTLDFNSLPAGTIIDDEYEGVTISAVGGSNKAMTFDTANPTGDDTDLASDTLEGVLIISTDGDSSDPDDHDGGGSIFFDFDDVVRMKSITFKDIEETTGGGTRIFFYDEDGNVIHEGFVEPTTDGGEVTVALSVPGTARMEVVLPGSGAIDNIVFDDPKLPGPLDGIVSNGDDDALIDVTYTGDPQGDMIDAGDAVLAGEGPDDDIVDAKGGDDTIIAGAGDDDIYAGEGDDVVEGGDGDDLIFGDREMLDAATVGGNDHLSGGDGADTIYGEAGDDTIIGGAGSDVMYGGDDADTFIGGENADYVHGGDGGNDYDTLDLRDSGPLRVVGETEDADGNSTSGTIEFLDADGAVTGSMWFEEIENLLLPEENGAPVTVDDALETDEDTPSEPLNVLTNDSDPDGDPLELISATSPDGTVSFTPEGEVVFTPNPDFNGTTTIDYVVTDPSGAETPGTVNVTVNPVNDAPVARDDADVTPEDTAITVDLLANDSDVDGDELSVVSVTVPEDQGTVVNNGDGTATFTPADNFNGEVTLSYTIEDEEGLQDSAEHTVYVNARSDVPVANDDAAETPEDTPITIDALANDTDPDGDETLFISDASVPEEQGTVEIVDNQLVFTPAPDFNGEATIDYIAQDPDGNQSPAQVVVTVTPVNDAPVAEDDSDVTDLNTAVTVDLLANDSDVDGDTLTVVDATVPADQGSLFNNGDGTVTFTPAIDFTGEATISYTIEDEEGLQDSAVHTITVSDPSEAPTAVDDTAETPEDTPVTVDVLANDTDPQDDPLTITSATVPEEQGTVEIVDNQLVFTPAEDFNGPATISYTVEDPDGNADEGEAVVNVTPVNDAPVAEDDADVTDFNTPVTVDLLANDSDVDGDVLTVVDATVPAEQGSLINNGDGTVTFTPLDGFEGEATISYTIEDEEGLQDSAEHTITVGDNTAPVAVDDTAETPEDTEVVVDLLGNDTDENGDPLTLVEATVPEEQGTLVDNGDGTVTFTPAPDYNGPATITYTVADPSGATDEGQAVVTVTPVNDAPVAADDSDVTDLNTAVTVDLLANDSDVDGDTLTVVDATVPADQGSLVNNGDGTVTFTPLDGFEGEATISYTIEDEEGLQDSAVHTITVSDPSEAPTAVDDTAETPEDTPVTVDVLANDTDPQDDPLTITSATVPEEQGTVEIVDNQLVFTPAEDFNGPATISYTVEDPDGNADEGEAVVNVTPVNDAPVAVDDLSTTEEDTPVVLDLVENDSDPDGDPLTVTDVSVPADQGTIVNNGDGTATFTPAPDFVGEATVTYTIQDPDGEEATAVHVVDVTPINDAPVAVDDEAETDQGVPVVVDLLGNDTDVDGDPLTIGELSVPEEQGTVVDNGDGTVTFTPAPDFTGPATITYTVEDGNNGEDEGQAVVTVLPEDLTPDGYVDGTDEGELIDEDYLGDPDGDMVNDPEAILPGTGPDDDYVRAGGGDDTIETGQGNDTVEGGDGDDIIDTRGDDLAPDLGYPFADTDPIGYLPDEDPENDRDSVDGGAGNDTITTGDDRDTINGGDGDDVIDGGIDDDIISGDDGDDRIVGGEGNDVINGGNGNDTIYGGNDPDLGLDILDLPDEETDENPFTPDRAPENGRDTINGGAGDDVIYGADDDDLLSGGSGNDYIDGEIDDDTIMGNTGDDTLLGGQGDDSLSGGQGNDELDGGTGDDTLRGNLDEDLLVGGEGDDLLDGGGGDDTLEGGEGDDTLQGGQGDDLIDGGEGNDVMTGGAGQDTFVNVNPGDDVDGGSGGPIDFDTLDLTGSAPEGGSLNITYTSDDREDGIVNYLDADGNDAGSLVFQEIENVIPCFTPGTRIATPKGERLVEELVVGDRVITRDNGIQEIRWVGARDMSGADLERAAHLKPVLIRQGALGNHLPERDMMVSPNHRVLVANDKTALYFEEREVLVAAKHLTGLDGVDVVDVSSTTYIHIMFDQHEVILSDGTWTESFQPGDQSLAGIGNAQRQEILELFPELATQQGIDGYTSARRSLKKHEAKLLTD